MLDKSFIMIKIPVGINNLELKLSESQKYFECDYEWATDIDEEMNSMHEEKIFLKAAYSVLIKKGELNEMILTPFRKDALSFRRLKR